MLDAVRDYIAFRRERAELESIMDRCASCDMRVRKPALKEFTAFTETRSPERVAQLRERTVRAYMALISRAFSSVH